jgi:hypothetical protein
VLEVYIDTQDAYEYVITLRSAYISELRLAELNTRLQATRIVRTWLLSISVTDNSTLVMTSLFSKPSHSSKVNHPNKKFTDILLFQFYPVLEKRFTRFRFKINEILLHVPISNKTCSLI